MLLCINCLYRFSFSSKKIGLLSFIVLIFSTCLTWAGPSPHELRLNQLGYFPNSIKMATMLTDAPLNEVLGDGEYRYALLDMDINQVVWHTPWVTSEYLRDKYAGGHDDPLGEWDPLVHKYVYNFNFTPVGAVGDNYELQIQEQSGPSQAPLVRFTSPRFTLGVSTLAQQYRDIADSAFKYYYFHRIGEPTLADFLVDIAPAGTDAVLAANAYSHVTFHGQPVPCYRGWCGNETTVGEGTAWADAGDFGIYPVNHAFAVWQLLNLIEFPADAWTVDAAIPEPPNGWFDREEDGNIRRYNIASEVEIGSQFMKDLDPGSGYLYPHKIHNQSWGGGFSTWDKELEAGVTPSTDPAHGGNENYGKRSATVGSTASTLAVCRTASHLARVMENFGKFDAALEWRSIAVAAFNRANDLPTTLYPSSYVDAPAANVLSIGGGPYDDNNISDDYYACIVEAYLANYAHDSSSMLTQFFRERVIENDYFINGEIDRNFGWQKVATTANLSLLVAEHDLPSLSPIMVRLNNQAEFLANTTQPNMSTTLVPGLETPLFSHFRYSRNLKCSGRVGECNEPNPSEMLPWGSNPDTLNHGMLLSYSVAFSGSSEEIKRERINGALQTLNYVLGENAVNISFVTGYGDYAETDTHDRIAYFAQNSSNIPYPKGWLAGGPMGEWALCMAGNETKMPEKLPDQGGSLEDHLKPWETGSLFFYDMMGLPTLSVDDAYELGFGVSDPHYIVTSLSNDILHGRKPELPEGLPSLPTGASGTTAWASVYGAEGTAADAWCTKENTVNYNSALLWMSTVAANFLSVELEGVVTIPFELFESSSVEDQEGSAIEDFAINLFSYDATSGQFELIPWSEDLKSGNEWQLEQGLYKIRVVAEGCFNPQNTSLNYVDTPTISFPEDSLTFNIVMNCNNHEENNPGDDLDFNIYKKSDWGSGYCKSIDIVNNGAVAVNWNVTIDEPGEIYYSWNLDLNQLDGDSYFVDGSPSDSPWCHSGNGDCAGNLESIGPGTSYSDQIGYCAHASSEDDDNNNGNVEISSAYTSQSNGVYCKSITVKNISSNTINSWEGTLNNVQGNVYTLWNANYSFAGSTLNLSNVNWNGTLAPGQETHSIGFCAYL